LGFGCTLQIGWIWQRVSCMTLWHSLDITAFTPPYLFLELPADGLEAKGTAPYRETWEKRSRCQIILEVTEVGAHLHIYITSCPLHQMSSFSSAITTSNNNQTSISSLCYFPIPYISLRLSLQLLFYPSPISPKIFPNRSEPQNLISNNAFPNRPHPHDRRRRCRCSSRRPW
jgi:hypothetical protein